MERYIYDNVWAPLRSGPSHKAEMFSQILFGERYSVIDAIGSWIKIETAFDNSTGWLDADHNHLTPDDSDDKGFVLNRPLTCFKNDKTPMTLEAGCEIYNPDFSNGTFTLAGNTYAVANGFCKDYVTVNESISETAVRYLNAPYLWGGRIPSGIDCSGFTQLIFKIHGVSIARNSRQQAKEGVPVDFVNAAAPGDLAFFDDEQGKITHVGMILSSGLVIHASGRVRIDPIDHQGIFKKEINGYSHKLRTIRRILSE
jgi:cell wall-associated NlpC family hydrolase